MRMQMAGIIAVGFLILNAAPQAMAQTAAASYRVTSLGTLGGNKSAAYAINASGQIAGSAENADGHVHAFLFSDGKMLDLGTLGGISSEAVALNNSGQVVGLADIQPGQGKVPHHAFLFDQNKMRDLGTLGGQNSEARGINSSGLIVGGSDMPPQPGDPSYRHAFRYSNGKMQDIGVLHGLAFAVNDDGIIAGSAFYKKEPGNSIELILRACVFNKSEVKDLGLPPNRVSNARAINAVEQVAGMGNLNVLGEGSPSQSHAFLYTLGTSQDLGTLGGETSRAFGISKSGMVVGSGDSASAGAHAFLYDGSKMIDLNDRVNPADLAAAGFDALTTAFGINDSGQIVGVAKNKDGAERAFLLSPLN
jgi:probable HAF family extracellular repeat protein